VKRALPSSGDAESDELALVVVFDGLELESHAAAFRGGSMFAWFGGIAADLRQVTLAPGASLTVHALFGGVAIRIPPGWRVESTARAFAGGVATRGAEEESAPTLTVDGYALFGGIAIGPKRELAEGTPG
jgi:Cell wall-active antibiotics response 4TMS YvqF